MEGSVREVASGSGTAMFEDGERLRVVDRGGPGLFVAIFVFGLVTVIVGLNGLGQLAMAAAGRGGIVELGAVLAGVGAVTGVVTALLVGRRRRAKATPPDALPVICVFDFAGGSLLDSTGNVLSPLTEVAYTRAFQIGSSSPALVLRHAGGSLPIAKGSPFGGGIGDLERALQQRGVPKS